MAAAPVCDAWGGGHVKITHQALLLLPPPLQQLLERNITALGQTRTAMDFLGGSFSESGDTVAGPCSANTTVPCPVAAQQAKMLFRDFCYAEDSNGSVAKPWPYSIPVCGPDGKTPPAGWVACIQP